MLYPVNADYLDNKFQLLFILNIIDPLNKIHSESEAKSIQLTVISNSKRIEMKHITVI
jgi:hypothetical protein